MKSVNFYVNEIGVLDWLGKNDQKQFIRFSDRTERRFDGKLHNLEGPAVIWADNKEEYWIHGEKFETRQSWEKISKILS